METTEFLKKSIDICDEYAEKGECSKKCPLFKYHCGIPDISDIDECIEFVKDYHKNRYPFGYCKICGFKFTSELVDTYKITHCPMCGAKITDTAEE